MENRRWLHVHKRRCTCLCKWRERNVYSIGLLWYLRSSKKYFDLTRWASQSLCGRNKLWCQCNSRVWNRYQKRFIFDAGSFYVIHFAMAIFGWLGRSHVLRYTISGWSAFWTGYTLFIKTGRAVCQRAGNRDSDRNRIRVLFVFDGWKRTKLSYSFRYGRLYGYRSGGSGWRCTKGYLFYVAGNGITSGGQSSWGRTWTKWNWFSLQYSVAGSGWCGYL